MSKSQEIVEERFRGSRAIDASEARQSFSEVVGDAAAHGRRIVILRHGRPLAALVSLADLDQLLAQDQAADQLLSRMPIDLENSVPFEEFVGSAALEPVATPHPASSPALTVRATEAAVAAITSVVGSHIVDTIVDELKRLTEEHSLDEKQASEIKERVIASVQAATIEEERRPVEETRQLASAGADI